MESMNRDFNSELEKLANDHQVAGIQVAATLDGELCYADSAGHCHLEREIEMNRRSILRTASLSKMITAAAVMQLAETGYIKLSTDINEQLQLDVEIKNPNDPESAITPKMLLNHSSGMGDGFYVNYTVASREAAGLGKISDYPTLNQVFHPKGAFYTEENWTSIRPGEGFHYSNLAYIVLGALIEEASGMDFNSYTNNYILRPLEMQSSSFNITDLINENCSIYEDWSQCTAFGDICPLYRRIDYNDSMEFSHTDFDPTITGWELNKSFLQNYPIGKNGAVFSPQGGLFSTAVDLSKFARALINKGEFRHSRILQGESVQAMEDISIVFEQKQPDNLLGLFQYMGLGLQTTSDLLRNTTNDKKEIELKGHPGAAYGLISGCYYSREQDFSMVYLVNGADTVKSGKHSSFYLVEEEVADFIYSVIKEFKV